MDHLNFFEPFESRDGYHEDVLTRNFLIIVKNIPLVQVAFFELIRKKLAEKDVLIESISQGELSVTDVYTQVSESNSIFDRVSGGKLVSVIISDEEFKTDHTVSESDRSARYDGVFICDPSTIFIIENKPWVGNIWENQLDPNIKKLQDVEIVETPCALSWREIINSINNLNEHDVFSPLERAIINDFTEYVDQYYGWLNPYNKFHLCKSNKYLLDHRCTQIMSEYSDSIKPHKGWTSYVDGCMQIQRIFLDSSVQEGDWKINLWMYVGDTMNSARVAYDTIDLEKMLALKNNDPGFSFGANLHFSPQRKGEVWCASSLSIEEYIDYWQKQRKHNRINQIKREDYDGYLNDLLQNGQMNEANIEEFNNKIASKNWQKVNLCPGFLIKYTWSKERAIELDRNGKFAESYLNVVRAVFAVFGVTVSNSLRDL